MRYVLLDRILELEPDRRIVAVKNVTIGDGLVREHGAGLRVLPSSMLLEAMAQAAGLLAAVTVDFAAQPVLAKVAPFACAAWARPGDAVILEARLEDVRDEGCRAAVTASIDGRPVAEASIFLALVRLGAELEARRVRLQREHLADLFPEWFGPRPAEEATG
jgi:3-hydroxyacyl-[acyl-carrier-protein] dehydratase